MFMASKISEHGSRTKKEPKKAKEIILNVCLFKGSSVHCEYGR